jgi:hypothetical protein
MDALHKLDEGNLALETPPDPKTGTILLMLDTLGWINRITTHIPDPGCHCQRFYVAYSIRTRVAVLSADGHSSRFALNPPAKVCGGSRGGVTFFL